MQRTPDAACPGCGYSLKYLDADACPECGRTLKLSLVAAEPYRGPWLVTLVSLGLGAGLGVFTGLGLLLAVYSGTLRLLTPYSGPEEWWFLACALLYTLCLPSIVAVWVGRHRFHRWRVEGQRLTACLTALVVPGTILINALWLLNEAV